MAVDLTTTLAWTTASGDAATMLDELQPNILKAHARDHLSALFLQFGDKKHAGEAKGFLAALANQQMKSAKTQLQEISTFKAAGTGGRRTSASG